MTQRHIWASGRICGQWHERLVTRSSIVLTTRAIEARDREAIETFVFTLPEADRARASLTRLGASAKDQAETAAALVASGHAAFLAIDQHGTIAALAYLVVDQDHWDAEVAVIVGAGRKGQGIGWTMLQFMTRFAHANGLKLLSSRACSRDAEMISLEEAAGFVLSPDAADGSLVQAAKPLSVYASPTVHRAQPPKVGRAPKYSEIADGMS